MAKKRETNEDILKAIMEKGGQSASFRVRDEPIDKSIVGSQLSSSIIPRMQSVSSIEKVQTAAAEASVASGETGGRKGTLDNILEYSKLGADNTKKLVTLTEQIKASNEKIAEDNKELLQRLLSANEAMKSSMEEAMREASRSGRGGAAGGTAAEAGGAGGAAGGEEGGGIPGWLKAAAGVGAAGIGAKMLGGASKVMGANRAAKTMAGMKGFGKGLLKGGLVGAGALGLYTMSSEDIQQKLAEYGIDETTIAAAGGAGALGYGAYKAYQGVKGVNEAIAKNAPVEPPKVEPPKAEAPKGGKELPPRDEKGRFVSKEGGKVDPTKGAAEAAKQKLEKEAGETVAETAGKKSMKTAGADAVKKAIAKVGSSKGIAAVAKKVPVVGALVGLGAAVSRAFAGDYTGAGLEMASGVMGGSGVGVAGSIAIDSGLMARDVYQELYGKFPEEDDSSLVSERAAEIKNAVVDYIADLVGLGEAKKEADMNITNVGEGETFAPSKITAATNYDMTSRTGDSGTSTSSTLSSGTVEDKVASGSSFLANMFAKEGQVTSRAYGKSTTMNTEDGAKAKDELFLQRKSSGSWFAPDTYEVMGKNGEITNVSKSTFNEMKDRIGAGDMEGARRELDAYKKAAELTPDMSNAMSSPIIVNKGGDTVNNITNAPGGSGGAAGSPSRIPNPWDNQVFGNPWVAYP